MCACLWSVGPGVAAAQLPEPPEELPPDLGGGRERAPAREAPGPVIPWRVTATLGGGASIRLLVQSRLQQARMAPAYAAASAGATLPWRLGTWRPWVGLTSALSLSRDGTVASGVGPAEQLVLGPAVRLLSRLGRDEVLDGWWWLGLSAPLAVTPAFSPGLSAEAGVVWLWRAGLGTYALGALSAFAGLAPAGETSGFSVHPIASVEAGIFLDWEVLP